MCFPSSPLSPVDAEPMTPPFPPSHPLNSSCKMQGVVLQEARLRQGNTSDTQVPSFQFLLTARRTPGGKRRPGSEQGLKGGTLHTTSQAWYPVQLLPAGEVIQSGGSGVPAVPVSTGNSNGSGGYVPLSSTCSLPEGDT